MLPPLLAVNYVLKNVLMYEAGYPLKDKLIKQVFNGSENPSTNMSSMQFLMPYLPFFKTIFFFGKRLFKIDV